MKVFLIAFLFFMTLHVIVLALTQDEVVINPSVVMLIALNCIGISMSYNRRDE